MNRLLCLLSVLGLAAAIAAPAEAQDPNSVDTFRNIGSKIITESKVFPLTRSTIDGPSSPEPTIALLASNDGTVGKARFGYLVKDLISLDVALAAPISAGTGTFVTHKGVSGGATIEGNLRLVLDRKQYSVALPAAFAAGSQSVMGLEALPSTVASQQMTLPFTFDQLVSAAIVTASDIRSAGGPAAARATVSGVASPQIQAPQSALTTAGAQAYADLLDGERGREAFATAFRLLANDMEGWQVDRAVLLSLGAKRSRPVFTVLDGTSFRSVMKEATTGEFSLGVVKSASKNTLSRGYYVGVNVSSGKAFSATPRHTCVPVGTDGATQCRNAVVAEPEASDTQLYEGDIRYYFSGLKFAVGMRPAYDRKAPENERWSVTVPLMFLQNSKDLQSALTDDKAGLTGGLSVGVKDSPDGASFFAVFSIGSLFKLPGVPR